MGPSPKPSNPAHVSPAHAFNFSESINVRMTSIKLTSAGAGSSVITCVWEPVGVKSVKVLDDEAISNIPSSDDHVTAADN